METQEIIFFAIVVDYKCLICVILMDMDMYVSYLLRYTSYYFLLFLLIYLVDKWGLFCFLLEQAVNKMRHAMFCTMNSRDYNTKGLFGKFCIEILYKRSLASTLSFCPVNSFHLIHRYHLYTKYSKLMQKGKICKMLFLKKHVILILKVSLTRTRQ